MKTVSTDMKNHLLQGVTTLCTCIEVIRQDGTAFYFTDHDIAVISGGQTFLPNFGYARSSVSTSLNLEVDTSTFSGVMLGSNALAGAFIELAVTREDIEAGLYDFASVYMFLVNYEDPNMAPMKLRRGWVGEIESTESGSYSAEIRGLTQVLAYKIGEAYTPECRADLGDARCKIALAPPRWTAGNPYNLDDVVLGVINAATGFFNLPVLNPSFETTFTTNPSANVPDWVTYGDPQAAFAQTDGSDTIQPGGTGPAPEDGDFFILSTQLDGVQSSGAGITQDIDLVAAGATTGDLDTGLCRFYGSVWSVSRDNRGQSRVRWFAMDADGVVLQTVFDTGYFSTPTQSAWGKIVCNNALLPTGTRFIRADLYATKYDKHQYGTGWDNVEAALNTPTGNFNGASQFGTVAFQCTTPGTTGLTEPAWSGIIGSTQADGTAVWTCISAPRRIGVITGIGSNGKSLTASGLTDVAGFYDAGVIQWETGKNAGRSMEITTWAGSILSLFFRPYYPMAIGDRFLLFPGCDKTRATCQSKFANMLNFRGEPDVPGQDRYNLTPDAQTS